MSIHFNGEIIEWRGPAPFYFVPVPKDTSDSISADAKLLSYGWGVIPVSAVVGKTEFTTSVIPRGGVFLLPIKNAVRLPEKLELGDLVSVEMKLSFVN